MKTIINQIPKGRRRFGRYAIEIGYPWLSFGAIMALEEILKREPNLDILEFGSGGSTIFFSRRCRSVKSFETNLEWAENVKAALPTPSNVNLICCTHDETMEAIKNEPLQHYDVILVDSGSSYKLRRMILECVPPLLKKTGYLVVDNYDHRYMNSFCYDNWDVFTCDCLFYHGSGTRICRKKVEGEKRWPS